ncbi:MAG: universal stress protein [Acidobacteria bacterium]|nr:universal stress protein [Acidobacteriota bacterium]
MKILIAYDGSKHAQAALDDLRRAGLPDDTEATIISVAEMITPTLQVHTRTPADAPPDQPFGPKEAEMLTRQAAERIKKAFPKWTLDTDFETGSAAWAIVEKADKLKPDLIIVGSHGRSALGRAIFGSTSQRVATDARCSVRVARTPRSDKPPRILLCIDGSEYAEAALNAVAARSWPEGAEVRMISAVGPFSGMRVADFTLELDRTNTLQQTAAALLAANNILTSTVSKDGDPKQVILEHAEEWGADCIFLGSRGLNRFHRFWLGSVSTAVVARALCSVEIVRKAASV